MISTRDRIQQTLHLQREDNTLKLLGYVYLVLAGVHVLGFAKHLAEPITHRPDPWVPASVVIGVFVYAAAFLLVRRGHKNTAFILFVVEQLFHSFIIIRNDGLSLPVLGVWNIGAVLIFLCNYRMVTKLLFMLLIVAIVVGLAAYGVHISVALGKGADLTLGSVIFLNILVTGTVGYISYIHNRIVELAELRYEEEHALVEGLLHNVLPTEVAEVLKRGNHNIAQQFEEASVLFADIVGFTQLTEKMDPVEMVDLLNEVFSHFDTLEEKYGVEKIRTIGDNYMVAAGVPTSRPDHAAALAMMALDMIAYIDRLPSRGGRSLSFRIGINSGPMVGAVIGLKRFHYDVWGDTVNLASRMESHGEPGRIQVTQATRALLGDDFDLEHRGLVDIKGKGEMETWFLVRRREPPRR